jgi:hypothetical protein
MVKARRLGLSKGDFRGPSLHKIDNGEAMRGKNVNGTRDQLRQAPEVQDSQDGQEGRVLDSQSRDSLMEENIYGPPLSSDDEDEGARYNKSDDSDMENPADIKPSYFAKRAPASPQHKQHVAESYSEAEPGSPIRAHTRWKSRNATESPAKKVKVDTYESSDQDNSPLFSSIYTTKRKPVNTYSRATKSGPTGSQSGGVSSPQAKFKHPPPGTPFLVSNMARLTLV